MRFALFVVYSIVEQKLHQRLCGVLHTLENCLNRMELELRWGNSSTGRGTRQNEHSICYMNHCTIVEFNHEYCVDREFSLRNVQSIL